MAVDGRAGRVYVATGAVATLNARTGRLLNIVPLPGVSDVDPAFIHALGVDEQAGRVVVQYALGRAGAASSPSWTL